MTKPLFYALALALAVSFAACKAANGPGSELDSGTDASTDSGTDASTDSGTDSGVDSGPHVGPVDAGPSCVGVTCGLHARCITWSTGSPVCACFDGYQDNDGDGNCSQTCAKKCGPNAACSDVSGTATECACLPGYQDNDGDGWCLSECPAYCGTGANMVCDDTSGVPRCSCASGTFDDDRDGSCSPRCRVHHGSATVGPSASSSDPNAAFDGDYYTQLDAITSTANVLQVDYGASASPVIVSYSIFGYGYSESSPFRFQLEGSADGTSWTVLDSREAPLSFLELPARFGFENTTGYRYYRLKFLELPGGYLLLQEVVFNTCP